MPTRPPLEPLDGTWAVILGASSGFGAATALALADAGCHICGVHLDRRSTLANAEAVADGVRKRGRRALFFNANAADAEARARVLDGLAGATAETGTRVRVLLHSLAFGGLRPYIAADPREATTQAQLEMTLDVMANSLVYWVQDLVARDLFAPNSRIFAMTSSGGHLAIPSYGPVSAAKAALEAHVRQLAVELAPRFITANAILAGVTDTPAARKIPASEQLFTEARRKNPHGRLTAPEDVAPAIAALADPRCYWINGNVIRVDGGEDVAG